jgi:type II secretory ATPase GspE/PulE/Tfp pilus assembly ATPase PilB-like protein
MATPPANGGGLPNVASADARAALEGKIASLRLKDKEREAAAQAKLRGWPYVDLHGFPISTDSLAAVPEETATTLRLLCFSASIGDLRLGAVDPTDPKVREYVDALGTERFTVPQLYLISEDSLRVGLEAYRRVPKLRRAAAGVHVTAEDLARFSDSVRSVRDLADRLHGVSTTDAVTVIIAGGLKTRSSDIHVEAEEDGVKLRYRIDGVLYTAATLPRSAWAKMVSRLKLLSGLKINVSDRPQDGRFTIALAADRVDVRVSSLPTAFGESIVMRLLRWSAAGIAFEDLGLVGRAHDQLAAEVSKPKGMVLSTGPTGSGKTTTLYAIINKLNDAETKIITLEDPIEYKLKGVNQSQVDPTSGYTFAAGLRSLLRQDPDVVMVGEIRDLETADIAANAALTGHLVLSTLHTNNAAGAIPRFLGMGVKAYLLPPALNAVIGQRLVRRPCSDCRVGHQPDREQRRAVEAALDRLPKTERSRLPAKLEFHATKGCDACQGIGYRGQIGIFEVLAMTKPLEQAILEERVSESKIEDIAAADGMVTMFQDGVLKALAGLTTLDEVFRVTRE